MTVHTAAELRQAEHEAMARQLADFEARGGKIERLANGAMQHNAGELRPLGSLIAEASRVRQAVRDDKAPATKAHRIPNSPRMPTAPKRPKRPAAPMLEQALKALVPGDTATTLSERLGKGHQATLQLLYRLENLSKVERRTVNRHRVEWIPCR